MHPLIGDPVLPRITARVDADMLIKALNHPPVIHTKLQAAAARYESMNQS